MTEGQALDYFNAALKHGSLCAGTNYMIDRDDTVWECTVWAGGGIWDVKPNRRENTRAYHELRMFAAAQRRTTFEALIETPNGEVRSARVIRRTKMTQELLPCPHCGNAELNGPHFREYAGDHRCPAWWVECGKCPCGMEAYGETPDELIAAWNKRSNVEGNAPSAASPAPTGCASNGTNDERTDK